MSLVILEIRQNFLDHDSVLKAMDRAHRKGLNRLGGYIRKTAKNSIKRKNTTSHPGNPPHARQDASPLKTLLFYTYDRSTKSVLVGPAALGAAHAPPALEYGGPTMVRRRRPGGGYQIKRVQVRARPFMGPAEVQTRQRIPDVYKGILERR